MAHEPDYSYIYTNSSSGLSLEEIGMSIGTDSRDLATLCKHANVRPMAKWKPEKHATLGILNDTMRQNNNYGILLNRQQDTVQNKSTLTSDNFQPTYPKPSGGLSYPCRLLDFAGFDSVGNRTGGYYNGAPAMGMTCGAAGTKAFNIMDSNASELITFYAFFKGFTNRTELNNAEFSPSMGIDHTHHLIPTSPSHYLQASLGMDGLLPTMITAGSASFGVILFDSTNAYRGFYPCFYPIADYATRYTGMYQLPIRSSQTRTEGGTTIYEGIINPNRPSTHSVGSLETPSVGSGGTTEVSSVGGNPESGTYSAVPVLHHVGYWYPMFRTTQGGVLYGKPFTLKIGGQEMYAYTIVGSAVTTSGTPQRSLTTTATSVYVFVQIRNDSYTRETYMAPGTLSKFKLQTHISGTAVTMEQGESSFSQKTINVDRTSSLTSPNPSTASLTIPYSSSSYQTLIFGVSGLYTNQTSGIQSEYRVDSGSVSLDCELYYDDVIIGEAGIADLINVTYG